MIFLLLLFKFCVGEYCSANSKSACNSLGPECVYIGGFTQKCYNISVSGECTNTTSCASCTGSIACTALYAWECNYIDNFQSCSNVFCKWHSDSETCFNQSEVCGGEDCSSCLTTDLCTAKGCTMNKRGYSVCYNESNACYHNDCATCTTEEACSLDSICQWSETPVNDIVEYEAWDDRLSAHCYNKSRACGECSSCTTSTACRKSTAGYCEWGGTSYPCYDYRKECGYECKTCKSQGPCEEKPDCAWNSSCFNKSTFCGSFESDKCDTCLRESACLAKSVLCRWDSEAGICFHRLNECGSTCSTCQTYKTCYSMTDCFCYGDCKYDSKEIKCFNKNTTCGGDTCDSCLMSQPCEDLGCAWSGSGSYCYNESESCVNETCDVLSGCAWNEKGSECFNTSVKCGGNTCASCFEESACTTALKGIECLWNESAHACYDPRGACGVDKCDCSGSFPCRTRGCTWNYDHCYDYGSECGTAQCETCPREKQCEGQDGCYWDGHTCKSYTVNCEGDCRSCMNLEGCKRRPECNNCCGVHQTCCDETCGSCPTSFSCTGTYWERVDRCFWSSDRGCIDIKNMDCKEDCPRCPNSEACRNQGGYCWWQAYSAFAIINETCLPNNCFRHKSEEACKGKEACYVFDYFYNKTEVCNRCSWSSGKNYCTEDEDDNRSNIHRCYSWVILALFLLLFV